MAASASASTSSVGMYDGLDMEEAIGKYVRRSEIVYTGLLKMCKLPQNEKNDLIGMKFCEAKTLIGFFSETFHEKYPCPTDPLPTYNGNLGSVFNRIKSSYVCSDGTNLLHYKYLIDPTRTGTITIPECFGCPMVMPHDQITTYNPYSMSPDLPPIFKWLSKFTHHYTRNTKYRDPNWANHVWYEIFPELMSYLTEDDVEEAPVATMKEATDKMDEALVLMENARAMIDNAMAMMELAETKLS